jgi:hypothetical protein
MSTRKPIHPESDRTLIIETEQIERQRTRIFQACGIISTMRAAVRGDVAEGEPDYGNALDAAHQLLDDAAADLDPANFEAPGAGGAS